MIASKHAPGSADQKEVAPDLETPPPKVKRTTPETGGDGSAPKLPKHCQSKELLKERSPTMYYSPSHQTDQVVKEEPERKEGEKAKEADKTEKVKQTAVKAKAKSEAKPLKTEATTPARTSAVTSALTRQCTATLAGGADVAGGKPPDPSSSSSSSSEEEQEESTTKPKKDIDHREMTLEELEAKKAAHARYMRFSRSLKSKRSLIANLKIYISWSTNPLKSKYKSLSK